MKVFLKFTILCAWLLLVAALWQMRQTPATSWLSISRKMTEKEALVQPLTDSPAATWPAPALQMTTPKTGL